VQEVSVRERQLLARLGLGVFQPPPAKTE
jgi:hypothetical protein